MLMADSSASRGMGGGGTWVEGPFEGPREGPALEGVRLTRRIARLRPKKLSDVVQSTEGAFDAAVRANVEKDALLALLREELGLAAARQAQHEEAHTASAAAAKQLSDSEISGLRAQLAAVQSDDAGAAGGDAAVRDGAGSVQLSALPAAPTGLQIGEVQPLSAETMPSLQQLAAGWLSDDVAGGEGAQAGAGPAAADAGSSGSADGLMPVPVQEAVVPTAEPVTAGEELAHAQACAPAGQVPLVLHTSCCFVQAPLSNRPLWRGEVATRPLQRVSCLI